MKAQKFAKTLRFQFTSKDISRYDDDIQFWKEVSQSFCRELLKKRPNQVQYVQKEKGNKIKRIVFTKTCEGTVLVYVGLERPSRSRCPGFDLWNGCRADIYRDPNNSRTPQIKQIIKTSTVIFDEKLSMTENQRPEGREEENSQPQVYSKDSQALLGKRNLNLEFAEPTYDKYVRLNSQPPIQIPTFASNDSCNLLINPQVDPLRFYSEMLDKILISNFSNGLNSNKDFRDPYNDFLFGFDTSLAKAVLEEKLEQARLIVQQGLEDNTEMRHLYLLARSILECRHGKTSIAQLLEELKKYEDFWGLKEKIIIKDLEVFSLFHCLEGPVYEETSIYEQIVAISQEMNEFIDYYMEENQPFGAKLKKEYNNDVWEFQQFFFLTGYIQNPENSELLIECIRRVERIFSQGNPPVFFANQVRKKLWNQLNQNFPEIKRRGILEYQILKKLFSLLVNF